MQLTLEQYIINPMAKSALLSVKARETMRNDYMKRYNNLMVREHGRVSYSLFKDEKNNRYFIWFKIPSETVEKFYYDTVIEFYADDSIKEAGKNLFKYFCKFYSNDPAFVYTYAYVFKNNDLFIDELKNKMSKVALKKAAVEKNPYNQVGYVKSIYFAYLTMINKNLNRLDLIETQFAKFSKSSLDGIMDADTKISDRETAGAKIAKKKKSKKQQETESNNKKITKSSKNSMKIAKTKSTSFVKKSKTTSRIKNK